MPFCISSFKPQHFIAFLTISSLLIIGSIVVFNGWFYFNRPNSDLRRAINAENRQYDIIVIGSSRANAYVPFYENKPSAPRVLNLSAGGATPYEMKRRLKHSIRFFKPKKIIIGLDFFSFNTYWPGSKTFTENYFIQPNTRFMPLHKAIRFAKYSLDYRTLFKNIATLEKLDEETEEEHGTNKKNNTNSVDINAFLTTETFYMGDGYNPTPYKQYKQENRVFTHEFKELLEVGYANDIEIILITSPIHTRLLQIIEIMGLWPVMEHWKRSLVRTNQELANHHNHAPFFLYDAMIYTQNTTVDIAQSKPLYRETSHFSPALAATILEHIERTPHQNTPHYTILHPDNIDAHLQAQTKKRNAHNKKTAALYQRFLQKYEAHQGAKDLLGIR